MCFFMFIGWESISDFSQLGGLESYVIGIGINDHYKSVSRGLLDSRDVLYFIALIGVFLLGTITVLKSRTW
jgi:ABC-2 type transport system permease protein